MERDEPSRGRLWLALIVLLTVGCWMFGLNLYRVASLSVWDLQDSPRLAAWLRQVLLRYGLHALVFLLLGVLVPGWLRALWLNRNTRRAAPNRSGLGRSVAGRTDTGQQVGGDRADWLAQWPGRLVALAADGVLAVLYFVAALAAALYLFGALSFSWGLVLASELALAVFGMLVGAWLGAWLLQGSRGRRRLIAHGLALVLFSALGAVWLVTAAVQAEPLPLEEITITSSDKRALLDNVQNPIVLENGDRIFRASEHELNKLLAWWFSFDHLEGKANVQLAEGRQAVQASLRYPADRVPSTYVNLALSGYCEVDNESLELTLHSLQIGSVKIPRRMIQWTGRFLAQWVSQESESVELLAGIVHAAADQYSVEVVLANDGIRSRRLAKVLRRFGDHPDVSQAVSEHLTEFAQIASRAKRKDLLFDQVVRSAFQRAAQRSRGGNPVEENRAAILALGIALGHIQLESYIGDCCGDQVRSLVARLPSHSRLRGRPDWARHFWVSAAVMLLASDRVSDAAGLLKEELDAGVGGSGFSFGDLMADRAGTEFARAATRGPAPHSPSNSGSWPIPPTSTSSCHPPMT